MKYYEQDDYDFDIFDRVLVRNGNGLFWEKGIYINTDNSLAPYIFIVKIEGIGGVSFIQCIPYDGNEALEGTCFRDLDHKARIEAHKIPGMEKLTHKKGR
jgi:hypothetical protein